MDIDQLVEESRRIEMSSEQREYQRLSFAFGNTHLDNPVVTRDIVDEANARLANDLNLVVRVNGNKSPS